MSRNKSQSNAILLSIRGQVLPKSLLESALSSSRRDDNFDISVHPSYHLPMKVGIRLTVTSCWRWNVNDIVALRRIRKPCQELSFNASASSVLFLGIQRLLTCQTP